MIRDITLGQYYPVDSLLHKLDPRVKLSGTLLFLISLFLIKNIWGYGIATLFLAYVIQSSKVPFKYMIRGLRAVLLLLLVTVLFNLFLTQGETPNIFNYWFFCNDADNNT